jgi:hypothetical protein
VAVIAADRLLSAFGLSKPPHMTFEVKPDNTFSIWVKDPL